MFCEATNLHQPRGPQKIFGVIGAELHKQRPVCVDAWQGLSAESDPRAKL